MSKFYYLTILQYWKIDQITIWGNDILQVV